MRHHVPEPAGMTEAELVYELKLALRLLRQERDEWKAEAEVCRANNKRLEKALAVYAGAGDA